MGGGAEDGRVVDEDVDLPEGANGRRHGRVDALLPRHVHLDGDGGIADLGDGGAGAVHVDIADGHPRAFAHIGLGKGATDAARSPR